MPVPVPAPVPVVVVVVMVQNQLRHAMHPTRVKARAMMPARPPLSCRLRRARAESAATGGAAPAPSLSLNTHMLGDPPLYARVWSDGLPPSQNRQMVPHGCERRRHARDMEPSMRRSPRWRVLRRLRKESPH